MVDRIRERFYSGGLTSLHRQDLSKLTNIRLIKLSEALSIPNRIKGRPIAVNHRERKLQLSLQIQKEFC